MLVIVGLAERPEPDPQDQARSAATGSAGQYRCPIDWAPSAPDGEGDAVADDRECPCIARIALVHQAADGAFREMVRPAGKQPSFPAVRAPSRGAAAKRRGDLMPRHTAGNRTPECHRERAKSMVLRHARRLTGSEVARLVRSSKSDFVLRTFVL